ncbi:unnamed protein product [Prorocentrum cordatum]|uniref:Uncharacterized protein n=1 Tax=Prorocentrum cordatum TaxID=2364126 RepID=A0ABN9SNA3_9DINO|nr:unnamed protein product [Polarella glacialis]
MAAALRSRSLCRWAVAAWRIGASGPALAARHFLLVAWQRWGRSSRRKASERAGRERRVAVEWPWRAWREHVARRRAALRAAEAQAQLLAISRSQALLRAFLADWKAWAAGSRRAQAHCHCLRKARVTCGACPACPPAAAAAPCPGCPGCPDCSLTCGTGPGWWAVLVALAAGLAAGGSFRVALGWAARAASLFVGGTDPPRREGAAPVTLLVEDDGAGQDGGAQRRFRAVRA